MNKFAIKLINIKLRSSTNTYKPVFLSYTRRGDVELTNNVRYAVRGNDRKYLEDKIADLPKEYRQLFEVAEVEE